MLCVRDGVWRWVSVSPWICTLRYLRQHCAGGSRGQPGSASEGDIEPVGGVPCPPVRSHQEGLRHRPNFATLFEVPEVQARLIDGTLHRIGHDDMRALFLYGQPTLARDAWAATAGDEENVTLS